MTDEQEQVWLAVQAHARIVAAARVLSDGSRDLHILGDLGAQGAKAQATEAARLLRDLEALAEKVRTHFG